MARGSIQHVLAPPVRCRHEGAYQGADRLLREGRAAEALTAYLEALRDHPADGLCGRVLLARTAEAALDAHAPRLALDLAAEAVEGIDERPILRWATLAARAGAVRARAAAELGLLDDAARFLRAAQRIPHRNQPTERYVRISAVLVFAPARDALDSEMAMDVISSETVAQQLKRLTSYEMAYLLTHWGRVLQGRGVPKQASVQYSAAISHVDGIRVTWSGTIAAKYRRMATMLLTAQCGVLECEGGSDDDFATVVELAVRLGDQYLATRLAGYRAHPDLTALVEQPRPWWMLAEDPEAEVDRERAREQFEVLAKAVPGAFEKVTARISGVVLPEVARVAAAPELVPAVPGWVTAAEEAGPCLTLRRAWEISRDRGHHLLGPEHLLLAALADGECRNAAAAAGITVATIDEMLRKTMNAQGTPGGLTEAARSALEESAVRAWQDGVPLVRPSHVLLSVLSHTVLASPDEIAVRVTCGATARWRDPGPRLPIAGPFSAPARAVLMAASDGRTITHGDLISALSASLATPPTVRDRAAKCPPNGASVTFPWAALCTQWTRGIDLEDLVDPPVPGGVPDPLLRRALLGAGTLARADGLGYVGPEHLAESLRTQPDPEPGEWLVFTPSLKNLIARASTRDVVTVADLREDLAC
ncbi:Clp protease N-terminal domain-containing protein [Amycolatopsis jejuensis]|uniref:Clp protease N-terminal domain-containing protein n=1 Tax=Amycolatopsis jejuensis TaxID=330084 RepID=UPI0005266625|nr:Clp protease N-terminal domain-containing protein [Amycolatopsis jejuensis]